MAACAPAAPAADKLVIHDKYLVGKKCDQRTSLERKRIYIYIINIYTQDILPRSR